MNVKCFANWKLLYPEISGYYFCSAGPAAGYREQMVHANVELLQGSVVCKCSQGSTWDVLFFGLVLSFFARIWEFLNSCLVYQSRASGWSPSRTATSHYGAREGSPGVIRSGQKWRCPCPCQAPWPAWARLVQTCVQSEDLNYPSLAPSPHFHSQVTKPSPSPTVCRPWTPTGQLKALSTSTGGTDHCSLCKRNKANLPDLRAYCPLVYQLPLWQMANTHWIFTYVPGSVLSIWFSLKHLIITSPQGRFSY